MGGAIVAGRCSGTSGLEYYTDAGDLSRAPVPDRLRRHVAAAAYSGRFIVLSWRHLILAYMGETGDHVLVDSHYCSCEGFTVRTTRRGVAGCSHVYAARIALGEGRYRDATRLAGPGVVARIVWEALSTGFSQTLHRLAERLGDYVGDHDGDGEGGGDED